MDRPVEAGYRRKRRLSRIGLAAVAAAAFLAAYLWAPALLMSGISRNRIRTATVSVGPIESTITASGTVVPEFEQVLATPLEARIVRILKRPGDPVRKGEPIVELDVSDSLSEVKRIENRLAIKENEQSQLRVSLENTLIELRSQFEIKELEVQSLRLQVEQNKKLRAESLISDEEVRKSEVQWQRAGIELEKLRESIRNAEKATRVQLEGRELELGILLQEREDKERLLRLATTQSDRDGILTWVVQEVGSVIRQGELIARVADLSSFRVEATLSDVNASRLAPGIPARVRLGQGFLEGSVTSIPPTITDGVMTVVVGLIDKSNAGLRSNLRVDVHLVSGRKDKALKVSRGPAIPGGGTRDVFVVRRDVAVRTAVQFGISSFEETEVLSGLMEEDEVIVSDMTDFLHQKEVRLR